jgi:Homeodomain-like domain/Domain of unknown function (DUF6431)
MLTVGKDAADVERLLASGRLGCPGCGGRLGGWGHGRPRVIRGAGEARWRLRPRRSICSECRRTHVLLPVSVLARRADAVTVIGPALAAAAAGQGHRRIAEALGRPAGTVRGWLRRFAARAAGLRPAFTTLLCDLDADPVLPGPAGSQLADAVSAVLAAAAAVARRWGPAASGLSPWELACAVTSAGLLAAGAAGAANTSCPW